MIRSIAPGELSGVLALAEESLCEEYPMKEYIKKFVRSPEGFLVDVEDARIRGFAVAVHERGETRLLMLVVDEEYRRRGVAGALMGELFSRLSDNYDYLSLEVRESNRGAIEFYRKVGFAVTGLLHKYYSNGESAIVMGKDL